MRTSTRYRTYTLRHHNTPRLFAALARTHNTTGSVRIGTKENPFAVVNFLELATDNHDSHGSNENWHVGEAGRPASGSGDRPSRFFVLILSCLCDGDGASGRARVGGSE
ncbi:unnamed protein product [Pieris brassicae]|uniref:Uncharacterized protein n=1 Tax=Pieris brassicae TaxID=7116 RepID=A0A9P0THN5_PIEBR|nr:unnamed protein product [Pieris brassicae]